MAPDADAGKSSQRSDPFAPLTSELMPVGDGHAIYVESVGREGGVPAVYLHGGPGSGCQPDHRRLFDPERFHAVLFDQRGAGRSRPKGGREHNTLAHQIADMEMIRAKFGFERWMVVGGSWGATLALAYAQAHPHRVAGLVLRATFLGTREELEGAFLYALPRLYPDLYQDFLSVLPLGEHAQPLDAYYQPHPGPRSGRARPGRAGLARYRTHPVRTRTGKDPARSWLTEFISRPALDAVHGSALLPERLLHDAEPADERDRKARRHSRHHGARPL